MLLTTKDNPYNPSTQWEDWLHWDQAAGYYTNEYLARVMKPSVDLSDEETDALQAMAIEIILENDLTEQYMVVFEDEDEPDETQE